MAMALMQGSLIIILHHQVLIIVLHGILLLIVSVLDQDEVRMGLTSGWHVIGRSLNWAFLR